MKGEIVTCQTDDELILHGMLCSGYDGMQQGVVVIHVHGSYGNFYENFFLTNMAVAYQRAGAALLSVNTRGRDYFADFKTRKEQKYLSTRIGGIREKFEQCEFDIGAWVCFARERGVDSVVLQGHSLGAMKVVYYLSRHPDVEGCILMSPPDNLGLQKADVGGRWKEDLDRARELARVNEDEMMPANAYDDPISAGAYLALLDSPEKTGMFTYSDVDLMRRAGMAAVKCPVLATFATESEAVVDPLDKCIDALKASVSEGVALQIEVIQGANHSYHFREEAIGSIGEKWLRRHFSGGSNVRAGA